MSGRDCFTVIIPAYNAEDTVGEVVASVRRLHPEATVVVIDDGSWDDTGARAASAGAKVIRHVANMGYGTTLFTGLLYAHGAGADTVVMLDADGQHEPEDVVKLLGPVRSGETDLVIGSRYLPESVSYRGALARRLGTWFFARLISLLCRQRITDPMSGFQCLGGKALALYLRLPDFPEEYPDSDVIVFAYFLGCRIREVPVRMYASRTGVSMHGGLKSLSYLPKMLLSILAMLLGKAILRERLLK